MAGGKLSPRQKMINLMYLVFLAMIALNMGKQVLDAFGLVNQKFESSNKRANEGTSNALAELANKANENQAQYGEIYEQSKQIKELSDGLYSYIQDIKKNQSRRCNWSKRHSCKSKKLSGNGSVRFY